MAVHRLDEILAQTDPFDLAEGVERHVNTLDSARIRALVAPVLDRGARYYRDELSFLLDPGLSEVALRKAFVRFLKSNLRAIALFGTAFGEDVLKKCPQHRVVAIGEEGYHVSERQRTVVALGTAIALLIIGAAAEHAVTNARAAAQVPQPTLAQSVPVPALPTTEPRRAIVTAAPQPTAAPARTEQRTPETLYPVDATARPPRYAGGAAADPPPYAYYPVAAARKSPATPQKTAKPPEIRGAVVNVAVTAAPPAPEPTPMAVDDMPQAFSDATPLPQQSAASVDDSGRPISVATPKPTAKPKSWLHRTLMHFDPFQPGAHVRIP